MCFTLVLYRKSSILRIVREVRTMRIDIKAYLDNNKQQTNATSLNLRDLDAIAQAQHKQMWQVLRELEEQYLFEDD